MAAGAGTGHVLQVVHSLSCDFSRGNLRRQLRITSWMVTSLAAVAAGCDGAAHKVQAREDPFVPAAMAAAGIVLSHPTTHTTASNNCPRQTSSMESAITSAAHQRGAHAFRAHGFAVGDGDGV